MLIHARGAWADTRGVRARFLVATALAVVTVAAWGINVAGAPEGFRAVPVEPTPCEPQVVTDGFETEHLGDGVVKVRFTIPRRTFVHDTGVQLLVATNTNRSPCHTDEFLSCDAAQQSCVPAADDLRALALALPARPIWPAPGIWVHTGP